MRQIIDLYIGDYKVEWNEPPALLYTYQETDLTNPTVVKNSFSKTITIEGTPSNNNIFGQYWNVERIQGAGNGAGVYFNASKKTEFMLLVNSEVYESGYCKLDNVRTQGRNILYDITLYGGLGDFFYNLSTDTNGEKRKLSGLEYGTDLDFVINIDTVKEAWENIDDPDYPKWNTINFAPCYEGFADDFDSDKVLINTQNTNLVKSKTEDGETYTTKENFVLGTLPSEMSGAEMRDFRSYLQRPVLRMKKVIEACCDPQNNGGYEVELDNDFFNNSNPYWTDTWMTLPSITKLDYTNTQQVLAGSSLVTATTTGDIHEQYCETPLAFSLGEFPDEVNNVTVKGTIDIKSGFKYTSYMWFWNKNGDSYHTGNCWLSSLYVQLVAYNGDTLIGASNTYNLGNAVRHNGKLYYGNNNHYEKTRQYQSAGNMPIYDILGTFESGGFTEENASSPRVFSFTINNLATNITSLKLRWFWGATKDQIKKKGYASWLHQKPKDSGWFDRDIGSEGVSTNDIKFTVTSTNIKAVAGDSIGKTGTEVSKNILLNTENSPCDYLLSYCKQFGLYFTKDVLDKKVYIQTRKTFYQRNNVVDLTQYMDKSKEVKMTPITFDSKWYQFNEKKDASAFASRYNLAYGVDYGCKIVDTGYGFNSEKKDLLKDVCIKAAVEGLEKSKVFTQYANDSKWRPWMAMGTTYNLYNAEGDTIDVIPTVAGAGMIMPINEGKGMKYYDLVPKVQFHDGDGKALDGNDVLLFFSGFKSTTEGRANPVNYILSDDNQYMTVLNKGTPCWLFSNQEFDTHNTRLLYNITEIPVFERYRTQNGSGTITQSLDFGAPRELYTPYYTYEKAHTIYDDYWASYIEDMYSADNKILECYVRLIERPNPDWLRRFYWFDNAIWRLNKITDWNISSFDTTKMEFVKVDEMNNYTSQTQTTSNAVQLTLSKYSVSMSGETLTGHVIVPSGVNWKLFYDDDLTVSVASGTGTQAFTVVVPALHSNETRTYKITARADVSVSVNITQNPQGTITVNQFAQYTTTDVPASGGTCLLTVLSTFPWSAYSDRNYVTLNPSSGGSGNTTVEATFAPSDNVSYRTVTCTFTDDYGNNAVWRKAQAALSELHYTANGGEQTISAPSGSNVIVPNWLRAIDNGDDTFTIIANANKDTERRDGITFEDPVQTRAGGQRTFVIQAVQDSGEYRLAIERTDGSGDLNPMGGSVDLQVLSTEEWTLETDVDWATLDIVSGETDTKVVLTFTENKNTWREAVLTLTNKDGDVYTYKIAQGSKGGAIEKVSPTTLYYTADGGSQFLNIAIPNAWVAVPSANWFTMSARRSDGATVVSVVAEANDDDNSRIGGITVTDLESGDVYNIAVQQVGRSITRGLVISPNPMNVSYAGGNQTVNLTYNGRNGDFVLLSTDDEEITWDAYPSWTGDNGTVILSVAPNSGITQKTYAVVYNCEETETQQIVQAAAPPHADAEKDTVYFSKTGGTESNKILSNVPWTAVCSDTWFSVSPTTGTTGWTNVTILTQPNLTDAARMGYISIQRADTGVEIGRITVTQEIGDYIFISPSSIEFSSDGGTATFTINSNINWTIQ